VGDRSLKSASAREDQARVRSLAHAAMRYGQRGWPAPPVSVTIVAWSSRLDVDNIAKVIIDGMKGVVILNDSARHVGRLVVEHRRDRQGERYEVSVSAFLE
jgi:Holliday junction resolvase RusA-like endonuclease